MKKYKIIGTPSLDKFAPGGAPCPRGQYRDSNGKCVSANWNNIQASDSYVGIGGGYNKKGELNIPEYVSRVRKGKKLSDYILRGGKSRADYAKYIGKTAGEYFGMPGEALEPTNYTKAGLDRYYKDIDLAKKGYKKEEKAREDYEKARKKAQKSKDPNAGSKFAREYKEKGWDRFDENVMKEGYKGQWQDAVDEANARKMENYNLVKNIAGELTGYNAAGRIIDNPLGVLEGVGQTVGDVVTLPFGLAQGAYNYATNNNFNMGINPLTGSAYGEGLDETMDIMSVIPYAGAVGTFGKVGKLTKAADLAGDAGKFLTTQTPLKSTYKLLGKDTKFFNPGEQPHWLKGYEQTWDPDIADLSQLDEFAKVTSSRNMPKKYSKKLVEIQNNYNKKARELSAKAQEARDAGKIDEAIKLEKERITLSAKVGNDKENLYDKIQKLSLKEKSPFEKKLGKGSFGSVFSIPSSNKVVKIGRIPSNESLEELVKRGQDFQGRTNIAIPTRSYKLPSGEYTTVMNKVDEISGSGAPTSESYAQLIKDIQDLQDKGLYVDFSNVDNIRFNPATGKFNIYDLNTTGHYMSRKISPEMGYSFKAHSEFPGIQIPDLKDKSVIKILKDHNLIPDNFGEAQDLQRLSSSPNKSITNRLKQFFDRPPGPLMLGMPTGGGNMIKKNMNYYKQLLDSYDSKKMSAANRKFYNDLINTANKQDGMVTEAQLRELDRLKSGNFNFGKKGYAKGGSTNNYIELDIPKSKIQEYINQGYIVEQLD